MKTLFHSVKMLAYVQKSTTAAKILSLKLLIWKRFS